jgi:hypothetical protein
MLRGSCVDPSWESETWAHVMKLILVEQIPNILINNRTLKLFIPDHMLGLHSPFNSGICMCVRLCVYIYMYIHIYTYTYITLCYARARVCGKLEIIQTNSWNSYTFLDKHVKIKFVVFNSDTHSDPLFSPLIRIACIYVPSQYFATWPLLKLQFWQEHGMSCFIHCWQRSVPSVMNPSITIVTISWLHSPVLVRDSNYSALNQENLTGFCKFC